MQVAGFVPITALMVLLAVHASDMRPGTFASTCSGSVWETAPCGCWAGRSRSCLADDESSRAALVVAGGLAGKTDTNQLA
jgi:hypothetical protein